jgi:N-acetylglucosamine repressor
MLSSNLAFGKATRQHTREHNEQLVLRAIYDHDGISRADIARLTQLTRTSVSDVVGQLIERGLVTEVGHGPSSGGRSPILLQVDANARQMICLSLETEELGGALVDMRGQVCRRVAHPLQRRDVASVVAHIQAVIAELLPAATAPLLGIGVSSPGLIDTTRGVVRDAARFGWRGVPLGSLPVRVANEVNVITLAEQLFGRHQHIANQIVIWVDYGIGAGIIVNHQLFAGDRCGAGEIGHVMVVEDGELCGCGGRGCLETVANSHAIVRAAQQQARDDAHSLLHTLATPEQIGFAEVLAAYHAGDAGIQARIREVGRFIGVSVAHLVGALNIERVVLTGSVARFDPLLREAVATEVARRIRLPHAQTTRIEAVQQGADTMFMGVAALLLGKTLGLTQLTRRPTAWAS